LTDGRLPFTDTIGRSTDPSETQPESRGAIFENLTYFVEVSLASHSALRVREEDLRILAGLFSLRLSESPRLRDPVIFSLKMFGDFSATMKGTRLPPSLQRFQTWGMTCNGKVLTASIMESHRTESGCSLSDILEENPDQKYFLSEKATGRLQSLLQSEAGDEEAPTGIGGT